MGERLDLAVRTREYEKALPLQNLLSMYIYFL